MIDAFAISVALTPIPWLISFILLAKVYYRRRLLMPHCLTMSAIDRCSGHYREGHFLTLTQIRNFGLPCLQGTRPGPTVADVLGKFGGWRPPPAMPAGSKNNFLTHRVRIHEQVHTLSD